MSIYGIILYYYQFGFTDLLLRIRSRSFLFDDFSQKYLFDGLPFVEVVNLFYSVILHTISTLFTLTNQQG